MTRDEQYCVMECPRPTVPNAERQCMMCAEVNPLFPFYVDGIGCTDKCPDTAPTHDDNNICRACNADDDGGEFWNPMTLKCV